MSWSAVALVLIITAGILTVVKWIQGAGEVSATLDQRTAELNGEIQRRRAEETATENQRRERIKEFDAKAARATDSDAADALLREAAGDDPTTN